jgi:phosphoribosylaminoimidazole carboxylase (NCAIR synthetase)
MKMFVFCVISFEPIKIQTCSAPQNDRLNLSFVKDIHVVGKKMARNGRKKGHLTLYL